MTDDDVVPLPSATREPANWVIAFDADDTLWHNEGAFAETERLFDQLVAPWADAEAAQRALLDHERRRVKRYGYGVKSFALSMIATAIDLSDGEIPARTLGRFIDAADRLLTMETTMIDGARETLAAVAAEHRTLIITKGDLHHQLRRVEEAAIRDLCDDVEVVAEKDSATYRRVLTRHGIDASAFVMIGNSVVSDIAPVVEIGARAIHVPYATTWALETAATDPPHPEQWTRLDDIRQVPTTLRHWSDVDTHGEANAGRTGAPQ